MSILPGILAVRRTRRLPLAPPEGHFDAGCILGPLLAVQRREGATPPMPQYLVTMDLPEAEPDGPLPSIEGLLGTIRETVLPSL